MAARKPVVLAAGLSTSSASVHALFIPSSTLSTHVNPTNYQTSHLFPRTRRPYATAAHDPHLQWPSLTDPRLVPTPYEIFNQSAHEPYSKRRFYDLVKIYHPDRNRDASAAVASPDICLERYRLIVAANAILSDPSRRSAYDMTGQGWSRFRHDASSYDPSSSSSGGYTYTTYHRWRQHVREKYNLMTDDDPMYNATWEDWERWYERQRNPHARRPSWHASFFTQASASQNQVYMSNHMFLTLVAILAALGGVLQGTRANSRSASYRERVTRRSDEVGRDLMSVRDETRAASEHSGKDARIRRWVRGRDDYTEGEPDGRVARAGDDALCASGIVKDKDQAQYWKRAPEQWERDGR